MNFNTVGYDKEQYFIIRIAHSFTALIGSLAGSLTCSWAHGKEVYVYELNVSLCFGL